MDQARTAGSRVLIHHVIQRGGEARETGGGVGHHAIGAHDQRGGNGFAGEVVALLISGEEMIPALVVQQRLPHAPAGGFAHHLDGIAQTFDLRGNPKFIMQCAQGDLRPVAHLRAGVVGAGKHQTDELPVFGLQPQLGEFPKTSDGIGQRFLGTWLIIGRAGAATGVSGIEAGKGVQRVRSGHKTGERVPVPASIRILHAKQRIAHRAARPDLCRCNPRAARALSARAVGAGSVSFGSSAVLPLRPSGSRPGIEAPGSIRLLDGAQALLVVSDLGLPSLPQSFGRVRFTAS